MSQPAASTAPTAGFAPTETHRPHKSFVVTWLLALLLGVVGADRFYLGKIGTAIAKLLTLGGLGIWALVDVIIVLTGTATDKDGQRLAGFEKRKVTAWVVTIVVIVGSALNGAVNAAISIGSAVSASDAIVADDTPQRPADGGAGAQAPSAAEWADATYGTFDAVTQSGTGNAVLALPADAAVALVSSTHDGGGNFSIQMLDADEVPTDDLLVNTIGAYAGTSAYGLNTEPGEPGVALKVTANGNWTIDLDPISAAPALADAGTGDSTFLYSGGASTLTFSFAESGYLSVTENTDAVTATPLVDNEPGPFEGTVQVSAGPSLISIDATGAWTVAQK
jgi:TM2 domain-containing membrane protein YozV